MRVAELLRRSIMGLRVVNQCRMQLMQWSPVLTAGAVGGSAAASKPQLVRSNSDDAIDGLSSDVQLCMEDAHMASVLAGVANMAPLADALENVFGAMLTAYIDALRVLSRNQSQGIAGDDVVVRMRPSALVSRVEVVTVCASFALCRTRCLQRQTAFSRPQRG
jgi:hypothetical protein